ncbi:uncharacterized protein LOC111616904 [Centruroides sculpturatus]|uniref:uncharacterized protein LOC111616904 n=1 Tax=Centruroides sculpturatus TaxID=218467 RepID=UPI000C6E8E92|nr:uncharacterized protein LOC111616904 [Centruroides sculpturatus]
MSNTLQYINGSKFDYELQFSNFHLTMMIARATLLVIIVQVMIYYGTGAESRKLQQSKTQFSAVNKLNEPKYLPHFSENVLDVSDSSNATEKLNSVSSSFNDDKNGPLWGRSMWRDRFRHIRGSPWRINNFWQLLARVSDPVSPVAEG